MGSPSLSRRDFFRTVTLQKENISDDPLFNKYSRKTLGPRVYSTELVTSFMRGAESSNNDTQSSLRVNPITSGLAPYIPTGTDPWDATKALHLLRRTGFGFKHADVATLVAAGSPSAAVDIVMNINATPPSPPINWYQTVNATAADAGAIPYGADWTNSAFTTIDAATTALQQTTNSYRNTAVRNWMFGQALNQDISIKEKMTWFWYHFIPIDFEAIFQSPNSLINTNSARIFYTYMKMFRDGALGNFKTLIKNVAVHPAMMFYLNNQANTATAPIENFARELMELFTLGKDPLSQYTQADVVAAADVLTGWRVTGLNTATPTTVFDSSPNNTYSKHKTGPKQFSSFFNNTVIQNNTPAIPANGALELDALIDMIFSKTQVVSEYICRRLYRYFVYYDIDANIETNIITPLAQTFVANNWNILPVLKQLFKSEHFFDAANRGVFIKSPFDLVIGTLRNFNLGYNVSVPTNYQAQYQLWSLFNDSICSPMEQRMGSIPDVSGWNAYYQTPAYHEYWINTNTIQKRFAYLDTIMGSGAGNGGGYVKTYNGLMITIKVDPIAYVQQFTTINIADPNALVAECLKYLLPVDLSLAQKNAMKQQTLLYLQTTDAYWTTAWTNYLGAPANAGYLSIVKARLQSLLYTIVQLAEFQLM